VRESSGGPEAIDLIVIATGSELPLAVAAAESLTAEGIRTRVVSLPCWELFELQPVAYRHEVLPTAARRRLTIESGVTLGWERYAGDEGALIGIDHFGASAPAATIFDHFGFTPDRVAEVGRRVVRDGLRGRIPTVDHGHQPVGLRLAGPTVGHRADAEPAR